MGDTANPKPCCALISVARRTRLSTTSRHEGPPDRRDACFPPPLSWLTISRVLLPFLPHHPLFCLLLARCFGSLREPSVPYDHPSILYKSSVHHSTFVAPFSIYRTGTDTN
ncbi:hypothetical protein PMIN01_02507 [Paraphaeosphaeria minitans]|uniref:Uncharacterized protein n=1 Tax=Paraphaeosphaeria minitans TaxID=565426 RepID=A0A9P6GQ88_9PLEO|nr:hypothetical protein PMIN01_02507 [Paraphaeosphaeria minitans]